MQIFFLFLLLISAVYATPLHQAVIDINEPKVRSLVKAGADINAIDKDGKTVLHLAAPIGRYTMVRFLVENGVNVHLKDKAHKTALVYAIEKNRIKVIIYLSDKANTIKVVEEEDELFSAAKDGDMDHVSYYLSRQDINRVDKDGKTVLHIASEAGQFEMVAFLLNLGADRELLDHDGRTALNYAKLSGNKKLIELLTQQ